MKMIELLRVLGILKTRQIRNTNWQSNGRVMAEPKGANNKKTGYIKLHSLKFKKNCFTAKLIRE
jgi:hypothetical protein